ncbi:MAG: carbohydrate ABC transporter permease [Propionibacteriaceae bacterium]|jgi:ABC-type glycerol-3-phosphate transport system permease component|nr:carbohydrate ABC transporter permease [Propionibacteriaceae bacterium]
MTTSTTGYKIFRYTIIAVCGLIMAFPLFYMVSRSFMTAAEVEAMPPQLLPSGLRWENYSEAAQFVTPRVMLNSLLVSSAIVVMQLVLALPAAFALSKIPFRWTGAVVTMLVLPMFIPASFTLIPTFVVAFKLGMLNTYAGLIVPIGATISVGVLLFRQFFASLPTGLVEAARIDGAGWFRVFWSVVLPLSAPIVTTFSVVTFITAWNLYLWPQVIATAPDLAVINVALAPIAGGSSYRYVSPAIGLAGTTIGVLPALVLFLVGQKWLVRGVTAGTGLE